MTQSWLLAGSLGLALALGACARAPVAPRANVEISAGSSASSGPVERAPVAVAGPSAAPNAPPSSAVAEVIALPERFEIPADEVVTERDPLPDAPALPPVPPEFAPQVVALKGIVEATSDCWRSPPMSRLPHIVRPECARRFEELARAGEAGVYAIGDVLARPSAIREPDVIVRLTQIMAARRSPAAVPYLARALTVLTPSGHPEAVLAVLHALERSAGFPVHSPSPGTNPYDPRSNMQRVGVVRALRLASRLGDDRARYEREGRARLLGWLVADDARVLGAASIVADGGPHVNALRGVTRTALERLLARADSSAEARATARVLLERLPATAGAPT